MEDVPMVVELLIGMVRNRPLLADVSSSPDASRLPRVPSATAGIRIRGHASRLGRGGSDDTRIGRCTVSATGTTAPGGGPPAEGTVARTPGSPVATAALPGGGG